MIARELESQILRLYHVEKWRVGTIAVQLGVHHSVVERVLEQEGQVTLPQTRASAIDPYVPFIQETWAKFPGLPASRLWAMCRERGYTGARDHFRHMVQPLRPRRTPEAFLRLRTLPGEQAQIDWAYFGKITIGRAVHFLLAFVAVLSWSRAIFVRFFLGRFVENLLRGHERAFSAWKGVPRTCLYDNEKTIVLERIGDAIRFHPALLAFAGHYRFEPRPVGIRRGNEKGRVERAIRYIRTGFFAGRRWIDLDDLNRQAEIWCQGESMDREWPDDTSITVREAFAREHEHLIGLPENPFPTEERREVHVQKTPYVRFHGNSYSVPHTLVQQVLVVMANLDTVRILNGAEEVARHPRCYDKGQVIETPEHIEKLVAMKREAREHRGMDRLAFSAPSTRLLLERLAERGKNLGYSTARLLELLDTYGAEHLEAAVQEVLRCEAPHVHGVRMVLERERAARGLPPTLPVQLPADTRVQAIRVRPHSLRSYDFRTRKEDRDGDAPHGA